MRMTEEKKGGIHLVFLYPTLPRALWWKDRIHFSTSASLLDCFPLSSTFLLVPYQSPMTAFSSSFEDDLEGEIFCGAPFVVAPISVHAQANFRLVIGGDVGSW